MLMPHQIMDGLEITKQVVDQIIRCPGQSMPRNPQQIKFIKARVDGALDAYFSLLKKEAEFAKCSALKTKSDKTTKWW